MNLKNIGPIIVNIITIIAIIILVGLTKYTNLENVIDITPLYYFFLFAISLALLITFMSRFLDSHKVVFPFIEKGSDKSVENNLEDILSAQVNNKENFLSVDEVINNKNFEEIAKLIRDKIEEVSSETYFKELKNKLKMEAIIESFTSESKIIELRIKEEINRLSKRAIINLSLGMMLSIGGIVYLGNFVLNSQVFVTIDEMFINAFPKAIFVLLIEVFAYFFLKLYKQNLDDIKYYQNELTNIESKNLAVQIAKQSNNHKLITLCVEKFLSTERNFILEKDQSTIEIEKERISSNNTNNTLKVLKDIFKNKV